MSYLLIWTAEKRPLFGYFGSVEKSSLANDDHERTTTHEWANKRKRQPTTTREYYNHCHYHRTTTTAAAATATPTSITATPQDQRGEQVNIDITANKQF